MSTFKVIKASAGSGKTFNLVLSYLRIALLQEPFDSHRFKKILAITFTNKAATEMKERILKVLYEISYPARLGKISQNTLDILVKESGLEAEEISKRALRCLNRCLQHYDQVAISTIDSFVHRLVQQFAHDLELPQPFEIELDSDNALHKAVGNLLIEVGNDLQPELSQMVLDFVMERAEQEEKWQIYADLEQFLKTLTHEDTPEHLTALKELNAFAIKDILAIIKPLISAFEKRVFSQAKLLQEQISEDGKEKYLYAEFLKSIKNLAIGKHPKQKAIAPLTEKIFNQKFQKNPDHVLETAINNFNNLLTGHEGRTYRTAFIIKNKLYLTGLLHYGQIYLNNYLRKEHKVLISELTQQISTVVKGELTPYIYERLSDHYTYFMIDEFQDTSNKQWFNLLPLITEAISERGNVLCVGDGKQAIYRFRGGDVQLFSNLPQPHLDIKADQSLQIYYNLLQNHFEQSSLKQNYRSAANVVQFNNWLFQNDGLPSVLPPNLQQIYTNSKQENHALKAGHVCIDIFCKGKTNEDSKVLTPKALALDCLIQKLETLIGKPNQNELKPYKPSQVALLFRGNAEIEEVAMLLEAVGYKFISPDSLKLNRHPAVQAIVFWFQLMLHPNQKTAQLGLIKALYSTGLVTEGIEDAYFQLHITLTEVLQKINIPLPNLQLYPSIMHAAHHFVSKLPESFQENAYIIAFLQIIQDGIAKKQMGLIDFLQYWDEKGLEAAVATTQTTDSLQLISMHKSKGLEFPVVIIPFCPDLLSHDARKKGRNTWVQLPNELKKEWHIQHLNLPLNNQLQFSHFETYWQNEESATILDNLNLLYVAYTRAEQELHIILENKQPKTPNEKAIYLSAFFEQHLLHYPAINLENINNLHTRYTIGESENEQQNEHALTTFDVIPKLWLRPYDEDITLSDAGLTKQQDALAFGNMVHQIVAEVKTLSDLPEVINKYTINGQLTQSEMAMIENAINQVWQFEPLVDALNGQYPIYSERSIALGNGSAFRPDKLIETPTKWIVLEFKTGKRLPKHQEQALAYAQLLSESTQKTCDAYLIYILEESVKIVHI